MIKKSAYNLGISGFACGLGAHQQGCKDGYAALEDILRVGDYVPSSCQPLVNEIYKGSELNLHRLEALTDHLLHLKHEVMDSIADGDIPVTIGGDHSMAMATWSAVITAHAIEKQCGLIWIDAHLDAHSKETSQSENYHGMPAYYLLEGGQGVFNKVVGPNPLIDPNHLVYIGIRSYEKEEYQFLEEHGVKIFDIKAVHDLGIEKVMSQALTHVRKGTKGFGITVDVDGFDPAIAPGTGTREEDGLDKQILSYSAGLGYESDFLGLEIAEFNPHLDERGLTANLIIQIIGSIFTK